MRQTSSVLSLQPEPPTNGLRPLTPPKGRVVQNKRPEEQGTNTTPTGVTPSDSLTLATSPEKEEEETPQTAACGR